MGRMASLCVTVFFLKQLQSEQKYCFCCHVAVDAFSVPTLRSATCHNAQQWITSQLHVVKSARDMSSLVYAALTSHSTFRIAKGLLNIDNNISNCV